jgi:hypothetical protein
MSVLDEMSTSVIVYWRDASMFVIFVWKNERLDEKSSKDWHRNRIDRRRQNVESRCEFIERTFAPIETSGGP